MTIIRQKIVHITSSHVWRQVRLSEIHMKESQTTADETIMAKFEAQYESNTELRPRATNVTKITDEADHDGIRFTATPRRQTP